MARDKIHMLHGAIGSQRDWDGLRESLEREHFLTEAHDLYRYLDSDENSFDDFTTRFVQTLPKTKSNQADNHLLGYSLGGRLALHTLLKDSSLWKKAVIVSAHTGMTENSVDERKARIKSDNEWAEIASDQTILWSEFLKKWNQQGVLCNASGQSLGLSDRLLLEPFRTQIAESFRAWSLGFQSDLLEKMSSLTVPILWIVGEEDRKFVEIARKATEVLPNAHLQIVKNAGHRVPWEKPLEFHSLVSEWFSE